MKVKYRIKEEWSGGRILCYEVEKVYIREKWWELGRPSDYIGLADSMEDAKRMVEADRNPTYIEVT